MTRDTVVDKIRKLLALASSTNVHEAAAAAARAQQLMMEHKLAAHELDTVGEDEAATVGRMSMVEDSSVLHAWKGELIGSLARYGFCKAIQSPVRGADGEKRIRLTIVGTSDDANTVVYLYGYLMNEIKRLCAAEAKGRGVEFANAFKRGAVRAIALRLKELRKEQTTTAANAETALALINRADAAIDAFMGKEFPKLRNVRPPARIKNVDGFSAGRAAGERIALPGNQKEIGGSARQLASEQRKINGAA